MPDRAQVLQELNRRGALPEKYRGEYEQMKASGGIAPKGGFKPMSPDVATKLEEQVSAFAGFDRAVDAYKPEYSGPGSAFENDAQGWLGTGTPGQRDWWADFRSSDNVARNQLFGASLTPGESASYAATSITPNMNPGEIRANLHRRRELARAVLGRRAAFARSNGYMPEAVTAILGEYDPAKWDAANDPSARREGLSVDGVVDTALGLRGGQPGPPERQPDGSVRVRQPDGTYSDYRDQGEYERSAADESLLRAFGGDRENPDYRAAYRLRFGADPELVVDVGGGAPSPTALPVERGRGGLVETADAFIRGAADTVALGGADELAAAGRSLFGSGTMRDNLRGERAVDRYDEANNGGARFTGQLIGGAALPFGSGARTARELAKVGAIGGAAYGFGSGEGGVLERAPGALSGAALGAIGGYAFGKGAPVVGDALARMRPGPSAVRAEANALAEAGARQEVPLNAADVRPGSRNALAFMEASPGGAGPVQDALRVGNDALESAAGRVGGGIAQTSEVIGTTIQNAGRRAIDWSRQVKNDLYDQAERLSPTTTVRSQGALDTIDRNIAELAETPNANRGLLSLLEDMRADLTVVDARTGGTVSRGLSIASMRNLRTAMRGEIGTRNLTMTDAERRVSQVIDAASGDITAALNASNPRAAAAYQRADRFYRERQTYINDVLTQFIGPRDRPYSGEQAFARVMALTGEKGDRQRLTQIMRGLTADERGDVASTVASQLGRRTVEDDFSPGRFVTQAEQMTPGAREAIFGAEGAEAVNDLIRLATAKRDVGNSLNRSRSGQVSNYDRMLTGGLSIMGAGGGYAAGGALGAAAGAVGVGALKAGALNLSARLLTNPRFVQWLARAPSDASPAQITAHVRQLGNIATRSPAIRGELAQLQQLLGQSGTARSLASESGPRDNEQADRREPAATGW